MLEFCSYSLCSVCPTPDSLRNEYKCQRADHQQYGQRDHDGQTVGKAQLAEKINREGWLCPGQKERQCEFIKRNGEGCQPGRNHCWKDEGQDNAPKGGWIVCS